MIPRGTGIMVAESLYYHGPGTIPALAGRVGRPRTTIGSALVKMERNGHVRCVGVRTTKTWGLTSAGVRKLRWQDRLADDECAEARAFAAADA